MSYFVIYSRFYQSCKLRNTNFAGVIDEMRWLFHESPPVGTVSGKPQKLFGPAKPFLVILYLNTWSVHLWNFLYEKRLWSYNNMWIKQLCYHKAWDCAPGFCYGFPGAKTFRYYGTPLEGNGGAPLKVNQTKNSGENDITIWWVPSL